MLVAAYTALFPLPLREGLGVGSLCRVQWVQLA